MDEFERHVLGRDERDEDGIEAKDAAADAADDRIGDETPDEQDEDGLEARDAAADAADDGIGDRTPGPDREWTDEEKALIVSECYWPGTRVGAVARRYGLSVNQVTGWRSLARRGKLTSPFSLGTQAEAVAQAERTLATRKVEPSPAALRPSPAFAAIEVEEPLPGPVGSVSIKARGVMVRLDGDIATPRIAEIASALRALR